MAKIIHQQPVGRKRVLPAGDSGNRFAMDSGDNCCAIPLHKETRSDAGNPSSVRDERPCDACPFCRDVCSNADCPNCVAKREKSTTSDCVSARNGWCCSPTKKYTMCQLRRHNNASSAWLLVGDTIYDATPFVSKHPGGAYSILRKSGGQADCSKDMAFHSNHARNIWKKRQVGKLITCPGDQGEMGDQSNSEACESSEQCIIS
eukprot:CAMPEP_0197443238 /NCGR_PEP_ID=MMETSP1175-20131217/9024_1 /TAXON_ID=1003142 /ORGANISM="Triceratium dubium, Strain CCMP147" /LENGTH=203 /DNA_ID=CAMNT_0042973839 /DNA_START=252 /DNA_END=863 /DNA_ORIENTATION=+